MTDEDSISCQGFLSQGTMNVIVETIEKNTPPEPPVTRTKIDHVSEKDIKVSVPSMSYSSKNIKDRYKVTDYKGRKLVYLPRDAQFRVNLSYTKYCTSDLFVRIYPSSSDCAFKNRPITSCSTHGLKVLSKVGSESVEKAMKSIFEVHDPDVEYQYLDLSRNEVQVSALARFLGPEIGLDLVIKCYNSCQESFKKVYPKLNFSMERCVGPKKYHVLSEVAIYFKVCASPARDCKSMTLKRRSAPFTNGSQTFDDHPPSPKIPKPLETVTNGDSELPFCDVNGKRYYCKMVTAEMYNAFKYLECCFGQQQDADTTRKLDHINLVMAQCLGSVLPVLDGFIDKAEPNHNH